MRFLPILLCLATLPVVADELSGEVVYNRTCVECHGIGISLSPRCNNRPVRIAQVMPQMPGAKAQAKDQQTACHMKRSGMKITKINDCSINSAYHHT